MNKLTKKQLAEVTSKKLFSAINFRLQKSKMPPRFNKAKYVAMLSGPSICIEAIVFSACKDSGIDMDWCFLGGRAIVYSLGDVEESKKAIFHATPESNLSRNSVY